MKVFRVVFCSVALVSLTMSGCSRGGGSGGKFKVAFVTNNAADFWTIARRGREQAGSELSNVEVEVRIPSDGTAAEQRRIIGDLMAKALAGIAVSPGDRSNQ